MQVHPGSNGNGMAGPKIRTIALRPKDAGGRAPKIHISSSADVQVHPCLRTPTARTVWKVIKFGYPIMTTIASLVMLGLILHGVSRPVCVGKVGSLVSSVLFFVMPSVQSYEKSVGRNESETLEPGNYLEPLLRNE